MTTINLDYETVKKMAEKVSEYVNTEVDETDIGAIVILDDKHKVKLLSVKVIFATVQNGKVVWQVMKNRLKRQVKNVTK